MLARLLPPNTFEHGLLVHVLGFALIPQIQEREE